MKGGAKDGAAGAPDWIARLCETPGDVLHRDRHAPAVAVALLDDVGELPGGGGVEFELATLLDRGLARAGGRDGAASRPVSCPGGQPA